MGTFGKVKRRGLGPWEGCSPRRREWGRTLRNLSSRRSQSGQIQFSLVLVVLVALLGGYFFYALYPAFLDEIDVRQAIQAVANDGWHLKGREDLHRQVMDKLAVIGSHPDVRDDGTPIVVRGLGVPDDDVIITCTDPIQTCSDANGKVFIEVRYQRVMPLPWWTGKTVSLRFSPHADATLNAVSW
jgi:hypothetical protein